MSLPYEIEIFYDHVLIFGVKVPRPARVGITQWLSYWEARLYG